MSEERVIRNYKDTVFRMLFQDRNKLLELYNAMNGTHYTDAEELEIVTLENAIYMNMKNDLAFLIGTQLHLYEQQATITPNMPYRFLQYVTKEYEKLVDAKRIYGSRLQKLPAPRFVVFYNGAAPYPEEQVLRLSDAYSTSEENPQLELIVRVLNINSGYHSELMEQCQTLREYMEYVETVRRYTADRDIREAVRDAIEECIQKGILAQFLRENKAEVIAMSIFEYDEEATLKMIREQEREMAREEAWAEGREEGREEGRQEGREEGRQEGREEGRQEGTQQTMQLVIRNVLEQCGSYEETARLLKISLEEVQKAVEN